MKIGKYKISIKDKNEIEVEDVLFQGQGEEQKEGATGRRLEFPISEKVSQEMFFPETSSDQIDRLIKWIKKSSSKNLPLESLQTHLVFVFFLG